MLGCGRATSDSRRSLFDTVSPAITIRAPESDAVVARALEPPLCLRGLDLSRKSMVTRSVPVRDRLTAMGVVDSNLVVEHDSRRKPFGLRDVQPMSAHFGHACELQGLPHELPCVNPRPFRPPCRWCWRGLFGVPGVGWGRS